MLSADTGPGPLRLRGYLEALSAHGLGVEADLLERSDFTERGGYEATRRLLGRRRPRAIFAANDLMAMGALLALREAGLQVPDEVAVMGFDDIPTAKMVNPPLTTVKLFQEQLGRRAAAMLFERMRGEGPAMGRSEEMPFELVVRCSA